MDKKNIDNRGSLWFTIIASFSLAILDMFFMKGVFEIYFGDVGGAFIAFALATAANISALLWGKEVGGGKKGRSFMWTWIVMGVIYALIRAYGTYLAIEKSGADLDNIMLQVLYAVILAFSYIGTGTLIKWASAKLWNKDVVEFLQSKSEFEEQNAALANNSAAIWAKVKALEDFQENYDLLDRQYEENKENIRKVEHSVMGQIVMETIAKYNIDPLDAEAVMKKVLAERDYENERTHERKNALSR